VAKVPRAGAPVLARNLGLRVRALRDTVGITQERLAFESGIAKGTLSRIEAGKELPSLGVVELLADRLGVEVLDLLLSLDPANLRHAVIAATRDQPPARLERVLTLLAGPRPDE
jgi:transcriptional regulator with XRE-family HTH domain